MHNEKLILTTIQKKSTNICTNYS